MWTSILCLGLISPILTVKVIGRRIILVDAMPFIIERVLEDVTIVNRGEKCRALERARKILGEGCPHVIGAIDEGEILKWGTDKGRLFLSIEVAHNLIVRRTLYGDIVVRVTHSCISFVSCFVLKQARDMSCSFPIASIIETNWHTRRNSGSAGE